MDGVGRVVLDSAAAIPDGLLVFMPSYTLMEKLLQRWKVGSRAGCCGWRQGTAGPSLVGRLLSWGSLPGSASPAALRR